MKLKPILCPKCKSEDVTLTEYVVCMAEWSPGDDVGYNDEGGYFKVIGRCWARDCKHSWRLRGEIQITENLKARLAENLKVKPVRAERGGK
jgi:hypothetical protein